MSKEEADIVAAAENELEVRHIELAEEKINDEETLTHEERELDRRIERKFDLRILPWLFGIWLFAFIDRSNIGNAKIDGLANDLKLDGNKFNITLVVFYIPYIMVDVPSNWIVKHFRAGRYLPSLIIAWGLVSTFLGFTKSFGGLIAARFFLGMFEGGLAGGIVIYLAMFYRRHQILRRIGLFYSAAPLSGAFGGLLATGLAQIKHGGYNSWPWIFFIEGSITVLFGIVALFFIPHTPGHTKFLTEEERKWAMKRMKIDMHGATTEIDIEREKFNWHWVKLAFRSPNTWICSVAWFFLLIPLYSFSLFLPTIIQALGYTSTTAQLLTVPPNFASFLVVLLNSQLSDRVKMRGPFMIGGCILAIGGYIMLLVAKQPGTRYGGSFLIACGVYQGSVMVMGWLANNTAPHYVRATAIGFEIAFANCAAFVATFTYLSADAPDFIVGHSICIGALVVCISVVSLGIFYNRWENNKREGGHRDHRLTEKDPSLLGHLHPRYRYTL